MGFALEPAGLTGATDVVPEHDDEGDFTILSHRCAAAARRPPARPPPAARPARLSCSCSGDGMMMMRSAAW